MMKKPSICGMQLFSLCFLYYVKRKYYDRLQFDVEFSMETETPKKLFKN